jgi:hypothetical protein
MSLLAIPMLGRKSADFINERHMYETPPSPRTCECVSLPIVARFILFDDVPNRTVAEVIVMYSLEL